jgi:hypothetical protein
MSLGLTAAGWAAVGAIGTTAVAAYGANKAANTQADAAQAAQSSSDRQFDISRQDQLNLLAQQREDQAPYRDAGKGALAQIMAGLSSGGQFAQKFDGSTLTADPGYQFRLDQGIANIDRSAAASGMSGSGAVLKALARFNSGLASDEYQRAWDRNQGDTTARFNRLASVAGIGQTATNATTQAGATATGQLNTLGTNYANTNATLLGNLGEARASGYVAGSNAIGSGIKSLYNAYQAGPWTTGGGSGAVDNTLF